MRRHNLFAVCAALATFTAAAQEAVSLAPQGKQPRVAVGNSGLIAIVYGQGNEIFCRTSKDGGVSYAEPTRVGEVERLMLGMRRGPQVAAAGSSLVVTAIGREHGNLVSWRSADGGRTWVGPTSVNDRASSAREGLHGLAAGAGGSVHVVWLDLRDGQTKVLGARSLDQGRTWEPNRLVYASPEGTVCECCQPTVAANDHGEVAVMWRNSLAGARDMFLARSNDGGRTFGEPQKLGTGSWPLRACPMDGGGVAVAAGSVATVWRREEVVYAAAAGDEEKPLGRGRNAVVAFGPDGITTAWQTPEGAIVVKRPGSDPVTVGRGRFASLGAAPGGAGPVVLAWEDPVLGSVVLPVASRKPTKGR